MEKVELESGSLIPSTALMQLPQHYISSLEIYIELYIEPSLSTTMSYVEIR